MGTLFPFIPHQQRRKMADQMMIVVSERYGMNAAQLMEEWPQYVTADVYPQRISLSPRFGKLRTSTICDTGFELCPWRDHLPGNLDMNPLNPHHDIFDIELYLRGQDVAQKVKYNLLYHNDKLWEIYEDGLTNLRIQYFAWQLQRHGELTGIRVPNASECMRIVNYLTFGTEFDPRVNPLLMSMESLRAGVYEWTPGYVPIHSNLMYTPATVSTDGFRTTVAHFNEFPDLDVFFDVIYEVKEHGTARPGIAGGHQATYAREREGRMAQLLNDMFIKLAPPGGSPQGSAIYRRDFLVMEPDHNIADTYGHVEQEVADTFAGLAYLTAKSLIEPARPYLLSAHEMSHLGDYLGYLTPGYNGAPVFDFDSLYFWAGQAANLNEHRTVGGMFVEWAEEAGLLRGPLRGQLNMNSHLWLRISQNLHRCENAFIGGERLGFDEMSTRLFTHLRRGFGWRLNGYGPK